MPRRDGPVRHLHLLSREERRTQCGGAQWMWYQLCADFVKGQSVLDVGAGDGYGFDFMGRGSPRCLHGIDPLPMRDDILSTPIEQIPDKFFDVCVAADVIEHVEDDRGFLAQLERVARRAVFLSTPNWNRWHAANEFHIREYTPEELLELLGSRRCRLWSSDIESRVTPIEHASQADCSFGVLIEL